MHLPQRLVLGAKRNHGCGLANGELVAHWDDDDWHAPGRLSAQVAQLEAAGADLCGPGRVLYADPEARRAWLYSYPQSRRVWVAGNALLYRRSLWQRHPFPAIAVGEDTRFVWSGAAHRIAVHDDHRLVVGLVHAANTSRKDTEGAWWAPIDWNEIEEVVGADAETFLRG